MIVLVERNEAGKRFEARVDGEVAFIEYTLSNGGIALLSTEVPAALEGRGLAGKMVRAALDYARSNGLTVTPLCPFVASYIRKHPEYQSLVHPQHSDRVPEG